MQCEECRDHIPPCEGWAIVEHEDKNLCVFCYERVKTMEPNGANRFQKELEYATAIRKERQQITKLMMFNTLQVLDNEFNFSAEDIDRFHLKLRERISELKNY